MNQSFFAVLKASPIGGRLRAAKEGVEIGGARLVGRVPSKVARTLLLRRILRLDLARTAQVYGWRDMRRPSSIHIGEGSIIGTGATLDGREQIYIGSNVNLSSEVAIWTLQHDYRSPTFATQGGTVRIGDRAWISFRATVLPGVEIGEGAVVAAGAIVTRDVAPFDIVGGIPARKIGERPRDMTYDWSDARARAPWFI